VGLEENAVKWTKKIALASAPPLKEWPEFDYSNLSKEDAEFIENREKAVRMVMERSTYKKRQSGVWRDHRYKPVLVQVFVAEPSVEAFDVRILYGLAGADERQRDAGLVSPCIQHLAREFRPLSTGMDAAIRASRVTAATHA
jgi:hypothetical protein